MLHRLIALILLIAAGTICGQDIETRVIEPPKHIAIEMTDGHSFSGKVLYVGDYVLILDTTSVQPFSDKNPLLIPIAHIKNFTFEESVGFATGFGWGALLTCMLGIKLVSDIDANSKKGPGGSGDPSGIISALTIYGAPIVGLIVGAITAGTDRTVTYTFSDIAAGETYASLLQEKFREKRITLDKVNSTIDAYTSRFGSNSIPTPPKTKRSRGVYSFALDFGFHLFGARARGTSTWIGGALAVDLTLVKLGDDYSLQLRPRLAGGLSYVNVDLTAKLNLRSVYLLSGISYFRTADRLGGSSSYSGSSPNYYRNERFLTDNMLRSTFFTYGLGLRFTKSFVEFQFRTQLRSSISGMETYTYYSPSDQRYLEVTQTIPTYKYNGFSLTIGWWF